MKHDLDWSAHHALHRYATRRIVAMIASLAFATTPAIAQTTSLSDSARQPPTYGATFGIAVPLSPSSTAGPQTQRHRGPGGTICIRISAVARPGAGTIKLFTHWVVVENVCATTIRVQVCYYGTRNCADVTAPANSRKESILGMMPAIKDFRFEYRERF